MWEKVAWFAAGVVAYPLVVKIVRPVIRETVKHGAMAHKHVKDLVGPVIDEGIKAAEKECPTPS